MFSNFLSYLKSLYRQRWKLRDNYLYLPPLEIGYDTNLKYKNEIIFFGFTREKYFSYRLNCYIVCYKLCLWPFYIFIEL